MQKQSAPSSLRLPPTGERREHIGDGVNLAWREGEPIEDFSRIPNLSAIFEPRILNPEIRDTGFESRDPVGEAGRSGGGFGAIVFLIK